MGKTSRWAYQVHSLWWHRYLKSRRI